MEVSGLTRRPCRCAPENRRLGGPHSWFGLFFFVDEGDLLPLQGFEPLSLYAGSIVTIIASGTWRYQWNLNCSCFYLELLTVA
jgi:hypothetical protein